MHFSVSEPTGHLPRCLPAETDKLSAGQLNGPAPFPVRKHLPLPPSMPLEGHGHQRVQRTSGVGGEPPPGGGGVAWRMGGPGTPTVSGTHRAPAPSEEGRREQRGRRGRQQAACSGAAASLLIQAGQGCSEKPPCSLVWGLRQGLGVPVTVPGEGRRLCATADGRPPLTSSPLGHPCLALTGPSPPRWVRTAATGPTGRSGSFSVR